VGKRTGASFVAIAELANVLGEQGIEDAADPNLGGTVEFDWGWAKLVQAFHTNTVPGSEDRPFSPTPGTVIGAAAGLVINIGGKTLYHLGDTCLFGDLRLIAERTPVDLAFIPIGGHYTMDRHDAVVAAEFVGADTVIPVHYNTFPPIETDAEAFKSDVESTTDSQVVILAPGEAHTV
jgi:L-ascorbate metabolism protein UlaG (beta-lactamase superfamily)